MFKESFYTVQEVVSVGNSHKIAINLNAAHPIYRGHFPDQPVVPGVCTLQIIKECVADILNKELRFGTISSCKFSSLLIPSEELIDIAIDLAEGDNCNATVSKMGETVLKLKANFVAI